MISQSQLQKKSQGGKQSFGKKKGDGKLFMGEGIKTEKIHRIRIFIIP